MATIGISGDWQAPYTSRHALEVTTQIWEEAKLDLAILNGDIWDDRKLSTRFPTDDGAAELLISTMAEEVERGTTMVHNFHKRVKAKRWRLHSGNHEYRIWRAMSHSEATLQLMGIKTIRQAMSVLSIYDLERLKFEYPGEYPRGSFILDNVPPERNVWVEHGYITRGNAGYTATALINKRMCSVVCGHVEKIGLVWTKVAGNRCFFGAEGGTLSMIGEVGEGDNIYTGYPHSTPDYANHTQGFVLIHTDGKEFWPEVVRIRKGKAWWNGRWWKA